MDPKDQLSSDGLPADLHLGEPVTDATHAEFVQLLAAVASADDAGFLAAMDEWIDHTRITCPGRILDGGDGVGPRHCHAGEHKQVLAVAKAVRDKVESDGELELAAGWWPSCRDGSTTTSSPWTP